MEIIKSLSSEEKNLLQERLQSESNWVETLERIETRRKEIHAGTGGKYKISSC